MRAYGTIILHSGGCMTVDEILGKLPKTRYLESGFSPVDLSWFYDQDGKFVCRADMNEADIDRVCAELPEGSRVIVLEHRVAEELMFKQRQAFLASGELPPSDYCRHCHLRQDAEGRHFADRAPPLEVLLAHASYVLERGRFELLRGHPFGLERVNERFAREGCAIRAELAG